MNILQSLDYSTVAQVAGAQFILTSLIAANVYGKWNDGFTGAIRSNPIVSVPTSISKLINLEGLSAISHFAQAASALAGTVLVASCLTNQRGAFETSLLLAAGLCFMIPNIASACMWKNDNNNLIR